MALVIADRVQETTSSSFAGTGAVQLDGVPSTPAGRVSFASGVGNGNETVFLIDDNAGNWEISIGSLTAGSPDALSRDSVIASSAGGAKVNFAAGVKDVKCVLSATRAALLNQDGALIDSSGNALPSVHGQVRFEYVTVDQCRLTPFGGGGLIVNGVSRQLAGDTVLTNTGLNPNTLYYIYAAASGSSVSLEASLTGHAVHSNGVRIKSGDPSRTFVGMVRTNGSSQFTFTDAEKQVRSLFNETGMVAYTESNSVFATSSTTPTEVASILRIGLLTFSWERVRISYRVSGSGNSVGAQNQFQIGILGTGAVGQIAQDSQRANAGYICTLIAQHRRPVGEGYTQFSPYYFTTSGTFTAFAHEHEVMVIS